MSTSRDEGFVFISYERADSAFALRIARDLGRAGFPVWMDQLSIPPGSDFAGQIEGAISNCLCMLVVMPESSRAANNIVRAEVSRAREKGKPLLFAGPVDSAALREFGPTRAVDFSPDYEAGLKRLTHELDVVMSLKWRRGMLEGSERPQAPTSAPASRAPAPASAPRESPRAPAPAGAAREVPRTPAPPPSASFEIPSVSDRPDTPKASSSLPVHLGISAPRRVAPGTEFTARLVAYVESGVSMVRRILKMLSPRSSHLLGIATAHWEPGTRVKVTAHCAHVNFRLAAQELTWQPDRVMVDFDAHVQADAPASTVVLKFDVSIDEIVVATLRCDIEIKATARKPSKQSVHGKAARTAFASYSSEDRLRVLDRVAAVKISAGLDVFTDCLSLHPGEPWKIRLSKEIAERDVFLLFWSAHASRSQWVTWEWETALARNGLQTMQIHPLENGVPPPEKLKALHFGDVQMAVRAATSGSQ